MRIDLDLNTNSNKDDNNDNFHQILAFPKSPFDFCRH